MWMAHTTFYDWPSVDLADDEPAAGPRFEWVDTFVVCAGANHGTYHCGHCEKGVGSAEPCKVITENGDVTAVAPRPRGVKEVYFDRAHPQRDHDVSYVEAPAESGTYEFGPAQVRTPDATAWVDVPDTTDRNVGGVST